MLRFKPALRWGFLGGLTVLSSFFVLGQSCEQTACAPGTTPSTPLSLPPQGLSRGDPFPTTLSGTKLIVIHVKEDCIYCDLALDAMLREGNVSTAKVGLVVVSQLPLSNAYKARIGTKKKDARFLVGSNADPVIRSLNTPSIPTITLVLNKRVEAMWRGFDPNRGSDFIRAVQAFVKAGLLPANLPFASYGQRVPAGGARAPDLPLIAWRPLNKPALVLVTSSECPACQTLHVKIQAVLQQGVAMKMDVRAIDTASDELVQRRRIAFMDKYLQRNSNAAFNFGTVPLMKFASNISVYKDPNNAVGLGWANLMTPTAFVFGQGGRLLDVLQYRGSAEIPGYLGDLRTLMAKAVR